MPVSSLVRVSCSSLKCCVVVGGSMWIKHPHVEVCLLKSHHIGGDVKPCPILCIGALVSCCGITGCSSGSMQTSLHTSESRLALRSRISFCLIVGKPPFAQEIPCSTVIPFPHITFVGEFEWRPAVAQGRAVMEC